jgi:hypothetical protein
VTIGYATVGILGIPLIVWLTGKMTKIHGFMFIYGMMVLNAVMRWFVYRPGRFDGELVWKSLPDIGSSLALIGKSLIWLDPLTGGMFWIGVGVLGQSLIADVCDDDELKNGHRREGMFGAIYGWSMKASFALSFVLIGIFLEGIGFDPQWGSTRWMSIKAKAENHAACSAGFAITDDEAAAAAAAEDAPVAEEPGEAGPGNLTLAIAHPRISEKDGRNTVILSCENNPSGDLHVNLKSSGSFVSLPSSITIPAGAKSMEFEVLAVDDTRKNGARSTTITAWIQDGIPARASFDVIDDDGPALHVQLDGFEISENGGELVATLTRFNSTEGDAVVELEGFCSSVKRKDMAATVTIPQTVTIPAGEESIEFGIAAVDNNRADGQQTTKTFFRMRVAMCAGAAGPALLCFVLLAFYPLSKEKAEENRRKLEAIRGKTTDNE